MNWLVILLALLLAAGGGYSAWLGLEINQAEHGWAQLLAGGTIGRDEITVLVMTGSGLKATGRIAGLMGIEA